MAKILNKFFVITIWLVLWQALSNLIALPLLLPNPFETLKAIIHLLSDFLFWKTLVRSLLRVMIGFVSAVIIGSLFAIMCTLWKWFDQFFSPFKSLIRSTPISSFIILVLLWLSVDILPIFIGFLTVMPIIWQSVQQGILETDKDLLEMGQMYSFSTSDLFHSVYLPSVLPYFYTAAATGIGFAWKASIAAEVIAKPLYSIGKNLQDAKVYLQTDELFAWTFIVIMFSLLLESILKHWMDRSLAKRTSKTYVKAL